MRARSVSSLGRPHPVACLFFLANTRAHATIFLPACGPKDSALVCRLKSVLMLLDTAAALLAVLLTLALLAAFGAYRRKSRKLSPEEITHDAP